MNRGIASPIIDGLKRQRAACADNCGQQRRGDELREKHLPTLLRTAHCPPIEAFRCTEIPAEFGAGVVRISAAFPDVFRVYGKVKLAHNRLLICNQTTPLRELSMRAAVYLRVSTDDQTTYNQYSQLWAAAARAGWTITASFEDAGISGANGRDQRPGFDQLHRAITRREVDVVMAWSVDRLGRSLQDLVAFLGELRAVGCDLYLHQQGVDNAGRPSAVPNARRVRRVRTRDHRRARSRRNCPSSRRR
jgi:Resolvase, N terminal domain